MSGYTILKVLQEPYKASIVTSLSAHLLYIDDPSKASHFDRVLGRALHSLVNLDNLEVRCQLCWENRHHYLARLGARRLRHLSINCVENANLVINCVENANLVLGSTVRQETFSSVETLKWSTSFGSLLAGPTNPAYFPKLNALEYNGNIASNILLATRSIRRLQIDNIRPCHHPRLLVSLRSSPGRLTHLILRYFDNYQVIIKEAPDLFVQLQHLGSIPWLSHTDPASNALLVWFIY
ncbi:hypothetical protein M408DRAFT_147210 [Serendipita vermifera MAFF 305830]|uniref:Uncharacterized protein n=1 Tax=Serendipita vermifera MAFF 305830 TaxID=933852 RepID=A0A0C2WP49_SERVB|nr:hypothetical protein M408DRAFT_147210 [Serendipita vermifera MAFF 305830]